jgi:uncharacterized protein (TIGR03437 family)
MPFYLLRPLAGALISGTVALAQLIPAGSPVPLTDKPPVVFINGYQETCGTETFAGTFGEADQVLQANGEVSLFFDNCTVVTAGVARPSIEELGSAFGTFLAGLRYTDGTRVGTVDVVAHSMGGLILRSYLSGKQDTPGVFDPPAVTHVRKVVFLATPNFGTPIASLLGVDNQVQEMASGSPFIFDLATWNQGTDDLRGVDAVAAIGNGGTGLATQTAGFDDGVVPLTSASLGFYMPGRTRVVPYCHIDGVGIIAEFGLCAPNAPGIADVTSATDANARIIVSFLNGTDDWQSVGVAADQNSFLSADGGLLVQLHGANDDAETLQSADVKPSSGGTKSLSIAGTSAESSVGYTDLVGAGAATVDATGADMVSQAITVPTGYDSALTVKPGPSIGRVLPAASNVFPLSVAPGTFVAIYGAGLAAATDQAAGLPFPTQLSDVQVLVNGSAIPLYYASSKQIDAVIPADVSGLVKLMVQNTSGSAAVNVLIETAVPAIFTQDQSGTGAASAENAVTGQLVTTATPLHAGDYLALYLTGLGATTTQSGLDWANLQPTVTVDGQPCAVSYAGLAPGYEGLDQVNCAVPAGVSDAAAQVVVTSGTRTSNTVTIAVQ